MNWIIYVGIGFGFLVSIVTVGYIINVNINYLSFIQIQQSTVIMVVFLLTGIGFIIYGGFIKLPEQLLNKKVEKN